jgi:hypothetical protein
MLASPPSIDFQKADKKGGLRIPTIAGVSRSRGGPLSFLVPA